MSNKSKLVENAPHTDITYRIVGAAMAVHNEHGPGHREEFDHQAMIHRMADPPLELTFEHEADLPVEDEEGRVIFVSVPDFRVEALVVTELKVQTHPPPPPTSPRSLTISPRAPTGKWACSSTLAGRASNGNACSHRSISSDTGPQMGQAAHMIVNELRSRKRPNSPASPAPNNLMTTAYPFVQFASVAARV